MLKLSITKEQFELILSGKQKSIIKEAKKHWKKELLEPTIIGDKIFYDVKKIDTLLISNGLGENKPCLKIECDSLVYDKKSSVFKFQLGSIIEANNIELSEDIQEITKTINENLQQLLSTTVSNRHTQATGLTKLVLENIKTNIEKLANESIEQINYRKIDKIIKDNELLFSEENFEKLLEDNKKLEEERNKDHLTGLKNRRGFDSDCETIFADKSNRSLLVAFIDADKFKSINDTYGHDIGDVVLKEMANILNKFSIKNSANVYRFGGEEFILTLLNKDYDFCTNMLEELRENISMLRIDTGTQLISLSVSIGYTIGMIDRRSKDHKFFIDRLIKKADDGVYKAKKNGRNRLEYISLLVDE